MRKILFPAVLSAGLVFGACSDDSSNGSKGDAGGDSNLPTFSNVFKTVILGNGCALSQCHGASSAGLLRLDGKKTAYDNLVGQLAQGPCVTDAGGDGASGDAAGGDAAGADASGEAGKADGSGGSDPGANVAVCGCGPSGKTRVVAGKPEESLLIEKLATTESCGERMPPTGEPVSQEQLDLVTQWIKDGAKND